MVKYKSFQGQDYSSLHSQCSGGGQLFVDPAFPANGKSLYFSKEAPSDIEWKRPGELVSDPKLFVEGASASDFAQGEVGNCWFVAACSCIAQEEKLVKRIVPDVEKQEWGPEAKYAGIFHFHFFHFGEWLDVVIDDLLPTRNGRLMYAHSKTPNEFWSALLEKAYAKLFGDYESLEAGKARDALVDMMGGVGEGIDLAEYKDKGEKEIEKLWKDIHESFENHSLMSASIAVSDKQQIESKQDNGLVRGHAYSITDVREVKLGSGLIAFFKSEKIKMVRLRNPWGTSEWTGPWSDGSQEWSKISDGEKKDIGLVFQDDGEFWMSYDDFMKQFTSMDICHMINTSFFSFKKTWKENKKEGHWSQVTSGGCANHKETFLNNPQYTFDMTEEEGDVLISVEQEDSRIKREEGKENATIGFAVLKADLNRVCRMHDYWEKIHSGPYMNSRSIFKRLTVKKGRYLLVPSGFDPGHVGKFIIRVYAGKDPKLTELVLDRPELGGCCVKKVKVATQLLILKAAGLEKQDRVGGADPYCIIRCEDQEIRTPICYDTINPEWNIRVTFYREKIASDIIIQVKNDNVIRDELMGVVRIMGASKNSTKEGEQDMNLLGEGKEASQYKPGKLRLSIAHFPQPEKA